MKKRNWFERLRQLVDSPNGGLASRWRAAGASKHERGRSKPRGWHTAKRKEHKRQRQARQAQRGKR